MLVQALALAVALHVWPSLCAAGSGNNLIGPAVPAAAAAPNPCPPEEGEKLAQQFCQEFAQSCPDNSCGPEGPWFALDSGPGTPSRWRCYSVAALNANHTAWRSGPDYCSETDQILGILKTCKLPPAPPSPPGVPIFSPGMKIAATGQAIHTFRIPSLIRVGQTKTLLAFAEARKYSDSDFGPKALGMRRSTNLGASWQPLAAVGPGWTTEQGNFSFMNPNAIYDAVTKTVLLQFTYIQCDLDCKPPYADCCSEKYLGHEAPSLFQIASGDSGLSWSSPVSLDTELKVPGLAMGPGIGIQIPVTGKLLAMGHGYALNDSFTGHDVVIASDNHGQTWRTTHIFDCGASCAGLDEPQLALLPNGDVMANMRHDIRNCPGFYAGASCRAVATSTDQGESFGPVTHDGVLSSPICQGAIIAGKTSTWFSNPASKTARANFTVRKSSDNTKSWKSKLVSTHAGCGYSSMAFLEEDETVGFVWEADSACTIRFMPVTL